MKKSVDILEKELLETEADLIQSHREYIRSLQAITQERLNAVKSKRYMKEDLAKREQLLAEYVQCNPDAVQAIKPGRSHFDWLFNIGRTVSRNTPNGSLITTKVM